MKSSRLLLLPAGVLWLVEVLTPLAFLLRMSLYSRGDVTGERRLDTLFYQAGTWSAGSFAKILTEPYYHRLFGFTAALALVVTALTLLFGYILGYAVYRAGPREKVALILLIALPKFTNILVFVFGVKMIFGANGFLPVVAGEVLLLGPYAALTIAATLEAVPYHLVEAARGLGAAPWQSFRFVTLPLLLPAVLAATLFALVISLNEITLTLFLATRYTETLPRIIWPNLRFAITPLVAAASVILLALSLPALIAAGWWLRPRRGNR